MVCYRGVISTGFGLDQSSEPGQQTPNTRDGPTQQRSPKHQTLQSLEGAAGEFARAMGLPAPRRQAQQEAFIMAARRVLYAPNLNGINLDAPEWHSQIVELGELLGAAVSLSAIHPDSSLTLSSESRIPAVSQVKDAMI